ncbi:MAG: division/cell wall cluster transcriptional repressor MraZ [Elusimicrobia bacterium]|nr:division/cell wall cluster transcriptional repressor MraZ [Elusimicrobiota bacterium]
MQALTGRFEHSLDDKNRLFAPSRYRDQLNAEGGKHFMVAMGLERCVYVFLPSQWERFLAQVEAYKFKTPQEKRATMRHIFSNAAEAPLDDQGRILIPQALRDHAGLQKEVVVLGAGSRAELWSKSTLAGMEKSSQKDFQRISATLDL